ncbi:MAG: prepilin peptidase [Lachnospiraceae bacterium]|nr:prepilin peptidase [Lachnospiraceae bacterium]
MKIILLLIICVIAAVMDMITLKVNNLLILTGFFAGLGCSFLDGGMHSLVISLTGACIPILILMIPFILRLFGAGDIKLLSVIGVFMGPEDVFYTMFYAFLAGALIVIVRYIINLNSRKDDRIPFALPVLIGVVMITGG